MSRVKKQHYVPQFYLRNFSTNNESQIFVFDKKEIKTYLSNISNVGCEKYFYDTPSYVVDEIETEFFEKVSNRNHEDIIAFLLEPIQDPEQKIEREKALRLESQKPEFFENVVDTIRDKQSLEKRFSNFEGEVAELIRGVISSIDNYSMITNKQQRELAFAMAVQIIRLPKERNKIAQVSEYFSTILTKAELSEREIEDGLRLEIKPEYFAHVHQTMLRDIPKLKLYASILATNYTWILKKNTTTMPVYTSDVPISIIGHLGQSGLLSRGVEIVYPISSNHVINLRDKSSFKSERKTHCRARFLDEPEILRFNKLQVQHSERQVYCSKDNFNVAEQWCNDNPEWRESGKLIFSNLKN